MRSILSVLLFFGSLAGLSVLVGCQAKAKPATTNAAPKQDINLIGDLDVDPNYDPAIGIASAFDPAKPFANSVGMKLVRVRSGRFKIGSPVAEPGRQDDETQHDVTITKAFHIGVHEVTHKEWEAVMQSRPWHSQDNVATGDNYPATYITWDDARLFCQVLSRRENRTYRLPTEAEWEYATRAGSTGAFSFKGGALRDYAWYDGSVSSEQPSVVGSKQANAWGLHDVHGNVAEWCSDWYANYPRGAKVSPTGPTSGEYRVTRGGSWQSMERFCRTAYRAGLGPKARMSTVGFRVVLEHK